MGDNGRKKGKCHQGPCVKDPQTKPKGGRIEGGKRGWVRMVKVVAGEWRQMYMNKTLKKNKKRKRCPLKRKEKLYRPETQICMTSEH